MHVKQDRWKTASRARITNSLEPSGRQQRLQRRRPTPNNLSQRNKKQTNKPTNENYSQPITDEYVATDKCALIVPYSQLATTGRCITS